MDWIVKILLIYVVSRIDLESAISPDKFHYNSICECLKLNFKDGAKSVKTSKVSPLKIYPLYIQYIYK